jgi:hypothetical protein
VPFIDSGAAEKVFRHKVMRFLKDEGLLSEERAELLLSWRRSGFSVHNSVTASAADQGGLERLVPSAAGRSGTSSAGAGSQTPASCPSATLHQSNGVPPDVHGRS